MGFALWLAAGGLLLLVMALSGTLLSRMPVSTSMLYLLAGLALGPLGLAMASPALTAHASWLEHLTEVIVLLSLFTSGMKMSLGLRDRRWFPPLRLALLSMLATVAMITVAGVWLLALPLGAAVLGTGLGRLVLHLRHRHHEAIGYENFFALGLIGLAYGLAVLVHAYGFLAVFAAGLALRHAAQVGTEATRTSLGGASDTGTAAAARRFEDAMRNPELARAEQLATDPQHAPAYMARTVLDFNEQVDRIGEMVGVVVLSLLLRSVTWPVAALWFVPLMLLAVRPLSVAVGLAGSRTSAVQRRLIGWFGIRGIGSLYYLCFAIGHGLPSEHVETLVGLTVSVVVASIVVHGVSVTPLMAHYRRVSRPRKARAAPKG